MFPVQSIAGVLDEGQVQGPIGTRDVEMRNSLLPCIAAAKRNAYECGPGEERRAACWDHPGSFEISWHIWTFLRRELDEYRPRGRGEVVGGVVPNPRHCSRVDGLPNFDFLHQLHDRVEGYSVVLDDQRLLLETGPRIAEVCAMPPEVRCELRDRPADDGRGHADAVRTSTNNYPQHHPD